MTVSRRSFAILAAAVPVAIATRFVSAKNVDFGLQSMASPEASPMASPSALTPGTTIEMIDIAFNPKQVTIAANTDVEITIPNNGVATHTFVINDHKNEGKPNLNIKVENAPGETQTVTINAPAGDYYYWCDVPGHEQAGMFGTLTVE